MLFNVQSFDFFLETRLFFNSSSSVPPPDLHGGRDGRLLLLPALLVGGGGRALPLAAPAHHAADVRVDELKGRKE